MKKIFFLLCTAFFCFACKERDLSCKAVVKSLPASYSMVFGTPSYHIKWVDETGNIASLYTNADETALDGIFQSASTPVIAYPYWEGIDEGVVYPLGAIYPLDYDGDKIELNALGGLMAYFYFKLAEGANTKHLPQNFDWARFRALFTEDKLTVDVLNDPWRADWDLIAGRASASGFRASLIKPKETENLALTVPEDGPWVGRSPYRRRLNAADEFSSWEKDAPVVLQVDDNVSFYFCPKGTLKAKKKLAVFSPKRELGSAPAQSACGH